MLTINFPCYCSITQVNDVGRETAGMRRKILRSWKQYSGRKFPGFLRWIPTIASAFRQDPSGNHRKIPDRNTASMFQVFPVFSCRIWWQ
jgi:hypothetical protein